MAIDKTIPPKNTAIYKAAALINSSGARPMAELFTAIDFGPPRNRQEKLDHAFGLGWLRETPGQLIDITDKAREHFADQEPKAKFVGEKAPPRYHGDWRVGSLSPQHIPNRRGPREDAPAIYGANPTFHKG